MEITNQDVDPILDPPGEPVTAPSGDKCRPSDLYDADRPPFPELPEKPPKAPSMPLPAPVEAGPPVSRQAQMGAGAAVVVALLALLLLRRRHRRHRAGRLGWRARRS